MKIIIKILYWLYKRSPFAGVWSIFRNFTKLHVNRHSHFEIFVNAE